MHFSINTHSDTPIYLQIMDQIRYALSVGELRPGDTLPSIRKLEAELGVNRNTIRRAYLELKNEGTLILHQGKEAEIAPRARGGRGRLVSGSRVRGLAERCIQEAESSGIDSVELASRIQEIAHLHDARHPKFAFVECSLNQAEDFARATERAWKRRVVGIDLNEIRKDEQILPASVMYVLTTAWHQAEVRNRLGKRVQTVSEVTVHLSRSFYEGTSKLAGLNVGLILRDAESVAGYRELLRKHASPRGRLPAALLDDKAKVLELLNRTEAAVYTTPCREFIRANAPRRLVTQELLYELLPDELQRLKKEIFSGSR